MLLLKIWQINLIINLAYLELLCIMNTYNQTTQGNRTMTKLTKTQRKSINKIIRFYRERNLYTKVTSVRIKLKDTDYGVKWLTVTTRRSDCDKNSMRAILCEDHAFIRIGKRGGITVSSAQNGLNDHTKHVQVMLSWHHI